MFQLNEIVTLKKAHPCGETQFTVVRCGADFKIKCNKCGRVVLISLENLKKCVVNH